MANDISLSVSSRSINNGTCLVSCSPTGLLSKLFKTEDIIYEDYINNKPSILEIDDKYTNRFDNPSYYHGGGIGSVDGGDLGDGDGGGEDGVYDGGTYEG